MPHLHTPSTAEHLRLAEEHQGIFWKKWGPYLSERSWGTVREDYSPHGDAWGYLPHDLARAKAYRWGEDGIAGISDRYQLLCFSLALWNTRDPILKERLFGVVPSEGNHGEDVKEYYFYLDSTPTHSYMRYLYKYPQQEFPYQQLIDQNRSLNGRGYEFELIDTGAFVDNRYFDVEIEYAKAAFDDVGILVSVTNRGHSSAPLVVIPQIWFRNTWAWDGVAHPEPEITLAQHASTSLSLKCSDRGIKLLRNLPFEYQLGDWFLSTSPGAVAKSPEALFTFNETNVPRVYGHGQSRKPQVKDAFHDYLIHGRAAVNPEPFGTKAACVYRIEVPAGQTIRIPLRLAREIRSAEEVSSIVRARRREADEYYATIHKPGLSEDQRLIQRQALAGMLWTKQAYIFDVDLWLRGDNRQTPPPSSRTEIRNKHWRHLNSNRILTMPDKWEYPWFAAWDLAFQTVPLALVDIDFAKEQLWLLLFEQFIHPNGQIPAYEWEFSDLNPPVHAWAVWRLFNMEKRRTGKGDREFLEKCLHKLLLNFTWWINKVDSEGNNLFEGGFLGLDNITVMDRSEKLPDGVKLEQSDATGWVGFFCLTMMRICLELARENRTYEALATKFFQHYVLIGAAMKHRGGRDYSLWDEQDGFFYDVLRYPDGSFEQFKVRSLVGLIPLFAVERLETAWLDPFPDFKKRFEWFLNNREDQVHRCCWLQPRSKGNAYVLTILDERQLVRVLQVMFDESEFLSPYGIRSLSRFHENHPFRFGGAEVRYEPAESDCKIKGGNSNWRGPIWFPTNFLLIESLRRLGNAYGPEYRVPLRNRSLTFREMAHQVAHGMISIFERGADGTRAVHGGTKIFQSDPHWRDHLLFYEYFHGDNGAGLGASHQTGWTGLVANLIDEW